MMAGAFVVLMAAALALQVATVEGDENRICFATSTTEYCVCPNTCDCLPVQDDGICDKNTCDCNGPNTPMKAVTGTINKWPAGGWNGADWSSIPGSDFWYPGEGKHWWPGTTKDGSASGDSGDKEFPGPDDSTNTSEDGDPPYNPDLKDPTDPGTSNGTAIERTTPGNPSRPPPSSSVNAADSGSSSSELNGGTGQGTASKTSNNSGAMRTKVMSAQMVWLALMCLLSSLGALFAC